MSIAPRPPGPAPVRLGVLAALLTAATASAIVLVLLGLGALSLPGLAVSAITGSAALLVVLAFMPHVLVVAGPALIPLQKVWAVFPYEMVLGVFAAAVILHVVVHRPVWGMQLERLELANMALVGWALFSGLWCSDTMLYVLGVRRLVEGVLSLWLGLRLARIVGRSWFEAGLLVMAGTLTWATISTRMSFGLSEQQLMMNRALATDLGWGTSNFIATLLLLLGPPLIELAMHGRQKVMRIASWVVVSTIGLLQVQIASRAATVLFVLGVLIQLGWGRIRHGWLLTVAAVGAFTAVFVSPIGQGVLARFTNLRDIGSMVVRIWYFREAWRRTLDNLPWGIGLNQGFAYPDHLQNIDPHDYWLAVSSELGIIGVVAWVVVLVLLHRRLFTVARTPGWEPLGRALLLSFWLSQFHTLVEPTFQGIQYQYVYFWLFGGYLSYYALARASESRAR